MFDDIDSRVLQAVGQGGFMLRHIADRTSLKERVVDRALQRLRKQGKIEYGGPGKTFSGWRVRKKKP
jgi:DNA-binding IclR family transcriptional regulator